MNLEINIDRMLPRVSIGHQIPVFKSGHVLGHAEVVAVNKDTASFQVPPEVGLIKKALQVERSRSSVDGFITYEAIKYYLAAND